MQNQVNNSSQSKKTTPGISGLVFKEAVIFQRSRTGRTTDIFPPLSLEREQELAQKFPTLYRREEVAGFPEVSEIDVVRHFTRLSQWNYGIDSGFYPLGSCTMKYNPKVNETVSRIPLFTDQHPLAPEIFCQGSLRLLFDLERLLAQISGFDAVSLQPSAGAQGELCGLMMIKSFMNQSGENRETVLIPDTAHGTNPASSALCGFKTKKVQSRQDGCISLDDLEKAMDETVAALMITNPNTLGIFEKDIVKAAQIVHAKGGLLYGDGANLNAIMGIARSGDMGFDVVQLNLHKTFSTPHGGGGPGSGPVCVKKELAPFLPVPIVEKDRKDYLRLNYDRPLSIGKMRSFYGNFGVMVKAYTYIREMGYKHLRQAAQMAVLNANYLMTILKPYYHLPFPGTCMHECVFTHKNQKDNKVTTMEIAKALIECGFHPPTIYFPINVDGALMIEPTETESKQEIDAFASALIEIAQMAENDPKKVIGQPHKTVVKRVDETFAARNPMLKYSSQPREGE